MMMHMRRTNFYFPDDMLAALRALAKRTEISVSEHIRRAIDAYLKRKENK